MYTTNKKYNTRNMFDLLFVYVRHLKYFKIKKKFIIRNSES